MILATLEAVDTRRTMTCETERCTSVSEQTHQWDSAAETLQSNSVIPRNTPEIQQIGMG